MLSGWNLAVVRPYVFAFHIPMWLEAKKKKTFLSRNNSTSSLNGGGGQKEQASGAGRNFPLL